MLLKGLKLNYEIFEELLKNAQLTKKEFANLVDMNYTSITNWNKSEKIPVWVQSWLENYIRAKIADDILDSLEPLLKMRKTE